jgi:phage shock protein PspC (stress-responsive transcriptional regulator)
VVRRGDYLQYVPIYVHMWFVLPEERDPRAPLTA